MNPSSRAWSSGRLLRSVVLAAAILVSGCCRFQTVVDGISHWQQTRCGCTAEVPCPKHVSLAPPEGYLTEGPTIEGANMAAAPGPTALDKIPALRSEITRLESDNRRLQSQLAEARHTIEQQEQEIEMASQELKKALRDFVDLDRQVNQWQVQLGILDDQVDQARDEQLRQLDELEHRVEEILAECDIPPAPEAAAPATLPTATSPSEESEALTEQKTFSNNGSVP